MGLTGEAKREFQREYMRRRRAGLTTGSNKDGGLTETSTSEGLTSDVGSNTGLTPSMESLMDKLTDAKWRANLESVCSTMRDVDKECTYLGDIPLTTVCDLVECTQGVPVIPSEAVIPAIQRMYHYSADWK